MKFLSQIFVLLLVMIVITAPAKAMTFRTAANGGNCSFCVWIVADGEIDENTPEDFKKFHAENPYSTVVLNSAGGNLLAGLELGKIIRQKDLSTEVAKTHAFEEDSPHFEEKYEGICYSACAYAFLGGVERTVPEGDIGFHQFYSENGKSEITKQLENEGFSTEQLLSGVISEYLSLMDVSGKILSFASAQDKNSLYFPSEDELIALDITTGHGYDKWILEPVDGSLVAYTVNRNKKHSIQKVSTFCSETSKEIFFALHTDTKVSLANLDGINKSIWGARLILSNKEEEEYNIPKELVSAQDSNGYITVLVSLPLNLKDKLRSYSNMAIGIDAPMSSFRPSLWYSSENIDEDIKTWNVTWKNCLN